MRTVSGGKSRSGRIFLPSWHGSRDGPAESCQALSHSLFRNATKSGARVWCIKQSVLLCFALTRPGVLLVQGSPSGSVANMCLPPYKCALAYLESSVLVTFRAREISTSSLQRCVDQPWRPAQDFNILIKCVHVPPETHSFPSACARYAYILGLA